MRSIPTSRRRLITIFASLACLLILGVTSNSAQTAAPSPGPGSALSIPQADLIQPEALANILKSGDAPKPVVLQVGSHVLFSEAHIPGSTYAGPGSQPSGLQALHDKTAPLPRKQFIVLYCGCCPWNRCPNVGPAYKRLHQLGFTNVKVLYLANNFGDDWVGKGYPAVSPARQVGRTRQTQMSGFMRHLKNGALGTQGCCSRGCTLRFLRRFRQIPLQTRCFTKPAPVFVRTDLDTLPR